MLVCLCFVLTEFGNIAGFYIRLHSLCKFFSYAHPVLMQLNAIKDKLNSTHGGLEVS